MSRTDDGQQERNMRVCLSANLHQISQLLLPKQLSLLSGQGFVVGHLACWTFGASSEKLGRQELAWLPFNDKIFNCSHDVCILI